MKESDDSSESVAIADDSAGAMRVRGSAVEREAETRVRLNQKLGRSGDLNVDINQRGGINTEYSAPSRSSTPKRPGGYKRNDTDAHGNLSPGKNRAPGNKNIKEDDLIQSHHSIQHEWASQNVPGYKKKDAPAVLLESTSGNAHAKISAAQRTRRAQEGGFDTDINFEFQESYREMIQSGVSEGAAKKAARQSYKYYDNLGGFK